VYDLHNHLLPGIDDGAPDITSALEMAQKAVDDGITHMVCTPHIHHGRFDNTHQSIEPAFSDLVTSLENENIPLNIAYAAEVRIGPEILSMAMNNALPFLGEWQSKKVLLLEFPSNAIPLGSDKLIKWLINQNIVPMIAHPERNTVFQEHPERLLSLIGLGCLTQVTGAAFLGQFGLAAKETAEELLQKNLITIIASDAHNMAYRPPILSEAYNQIKLLTAMDTANQLFIEIPKLISSCKFDESFQ